MKQKIAFLSFALYSYSALGTLPYELEVTGAIDVKAGLSDQLLHENIKQYNSRFLVSNAALAANITRNLDQSTKYGARIAIKTTTKSRGSVGLNGTHIFIDHQDLGRLEVGSPFDAAKVLGFGGDIVARGSNSWNGYVDLNPNKVYGLEYKTYDFYNSSFRAKDGTEPARKISYYTPLYNGLQFGLSYTPDSTNLGDSSPHSPSQIGTRDELTPKGEKYSHKTAATNIFSGGFVLSHDISEELNIKVNAVGRFGQSIQERSDGTKLDTKIGNLEEFNIGFVGSRGSWSLAASYANLGYSFLPEYRHNDSSTKYLCFGGGYQQGPLGASITYLHTSHLNNELSLIELATDYMVAPGLSQYIEVSFAKGNGQGMKDQAQPISIATAVLGILFKI